MIADRSHTAKVRTNALSATDRMACRAPALKKIRPSIGRRSVASGRLLIALAALVLSPGGKPVGNHGGNRARVIHRAVAHPLAGGLVTDHQTGTVVSEFILVWSGRLPEFLPDNFYVFLFPSQEEPPRAGM